MSYTKGERGASHPGCLAYMYLQHVHNDRYCYGVNTQDAAYQRIKGLPAVHRQLLKLPQHTTLYVPQHFLRPRRPETPRLKTFRSGRQRQTNPSQPPAAAKAQLEQQPFAPQGAAPPAIPETTAFRRRCGTSNGGSRLSFPSRKREVSLRIFTSAPKSIPWPVHAPPRYPTSLSKIDY